VGDLPVVLGERDVQHRVHGDHPVLGKDGSVRVLLDDCRGLPDVGAVLPDFPSLPSAEAYRTTVRSIFRGTSKCPNR
jgi:hypothetical protein